uniref:ZZ-type domain-containing protein n=1 Tax=Caenorhabditis tropicalis TaxID=1561998 RepID=A0A1I7TUB2_9PELO
MAAPSSAPHQMQVRVTFYTSHNPQSVLMILKNEEALQQITEKAQELFPSADYRLFYGDVNGPIYEFTDSEQVMSKIRITTFSRTPQLFVRLESGSACSSSAKKPSKGERESKSSAYLKRIEQNQELTLKTIEKIQKQFERVSALETMVADIHSKESSLIRENEPVNRPFPPTKHSASCDACLGDIVGHRYKCLQCADYDLCEKCEKKSIHYEHALVRIVHPYKTTIPSYVTKNSPNNVFPIYMQTGNRTVVNSFEAEKKNIELTPRTKVRIFQPLTPVAAPAPTPAPVAATAPAPPPPTASFTGCEARVFNEETCAALINGASILKDTFTTLSKSFMDLADGAQANMEKKIIERSTMEAGVKKVEEKVDNLKRHCEEKVFGVPVPEVENTEESSKKSSESTSGPKIKKAKKKTIYKKTAEKITATGPNAASEEQMKLREEAKKRAAASTAELQRKLAFLYINPSSEEKRTEPKNPLPENLTNSLDVLMKAIFDTPTVNPPSTPVTEPTAPTTPTSSVTPTPLTLPITLTPVVPTAPVVQFDPIYPTDQIVETLIVPPLPVVEPMPVEFIPKTTTPISIHSSFENISSDFESLSPSFGEYQVMEIPDSRQEESDDLLEFSDVVEAPEETETSGDTRPESSIPEPSLPRLDSDTEKTFDRLLEMGFDYNVVVAAIREHGSNLEQCLFSLLQ